MKSEKFRCKKDVWGRTASAKEGTHMSLFVSEREKQSALRQKEGKRNGTKNQRKVMLQL